MDRDFLLQRRYELKFPACSCDKYLARCELSTDSEVFLSRFRHPPTAEVGEIVDPLILSNENSIHSPAARSYAARALRSFQ